MSIKTYRLLWVDYYKLIDLYAVPKDWELDKIDIKSCQVYYDGVLQENISYRNGVVDTAVPAEIRFEDEFISNSLIANKENYK
jgi:hypothetical protein